MRCALPTSRLRSPPLLSSLLSLARAGPNGRPEDKAAPGPIFTLTDDRPGADAVAAMGAALGAASVLFAEADERYSLRLLGGAYAAYDAAARNQATYNAAVPNAAGAGGYRSATFLDDMAWCAAWLFVRTGDLKYRWSVKELYDKFVFTEGAGRAAPVDYSERGSGCLCIALLLLLSLRRLLHTHSLAASVFVRLCKRSHNL